jgi:hypothetical protein
MNPSKLLRRFLDTGTKPSTQRDQSALLDESRSIIASQLQTTSHQIQNFTVGEIDTIVAGGKGAIARAAAIHFEKYANTAPMTSTAAPTPRPAAKQDRIAELCSFITKPRKPLSLPVAKTTQTPADKLAKAKAANNTAVTVTASGIKSTSQRGGRAIKLSNINL